MKFPDAPPMFGLLTLQLGSDCVGLTSGPPRVFVLSFEDVIVTSLVRIILFNSSLFSQSIQQFAAECW